MRASASEEALKYYQEGLKLYLKSHKNKIDPEKAAMFEKNIALVFYNKSRFNEAIPHFDKVFEYWGIPTHPNKIKTLPIFLKNIFLIKTGLNRSFKGEDPSKRDEQVLNILFKLGFALAIDDFNRASKIAIYMFNLAYRMNLSKSSDAPNMIMGFSSVIAIKRLTYNLPLKLLQICYEKMDQNNIENMINYRFFHSIICFYSGDWDKIKKNDIKIVNKACKEGKLDSATNYLWQAASVSVHIGDFHNALIMTSMLPKITKEYDYSLAKLHDYSQKAHYYFMKRELGNAIKMAAKSVELSRLQGREDHECGWLAKQAESSIVLNNLEEAQKIIHQAKSIVKRLKAINPTFLWLYHHSRFHLKIKLLKERKALNDKQGMELFKKDALQYSKEILKAYKNYMPCLPDCFKMIGELYWLIGKQTTALKWWTKSIKIGEKLGAKPDLSRTYFEIGKSLLSPESKYKKLNGITAEQYLDRAKTMFEEMELEWDLNELGKVINYSIKDFK